MINKQEALAYEFPEEETQYDERDVAIYALGIGAAQDPLDEHELSYVWEKHPHFTPFPLYSTVPALGILMRRTASRNPIPGLPFDLDRILHVAHSARLYRPLPKRAILKHRVRIESIDDERRNATVVFCVESRDQEDARLFSNEISIVIRGAGKGRTRAVSIASVQHRESPDAVVVEKIPKNQALLYRLSGDSNPLHVDPEAARIFGLSRPVLHGICTLGYASRMVLKQAAQDRQLRSVRVQFSHVFFPGETLETRIWKESDQRLHFCSLVLERQKKVLSCGEIELEEINANQ